MPERVISENEISLNAVRYPITRPVQSVLASIYPGKLVIGDTSRDSQQRASVLAISDWRGGLGIDRIEGAGDVNRAWWSTCQLRYKQHLVLPGLAVLTADAGVSGTYSVGAIGELASEIYGAFGTSVRKYNNTTDSWGSSLATLPAVASDVITARVGGTVYLIFACGSSGYVYTSDGVTFTTKVKNVQYMTYWDEQLWGIDSTGLMWSSNVIGTEGNDAQLQLPSDYVQDLFVGRNALGDLIIYAMTKVGLYAHDSANAKLVETELGLPFHPDIGKGSTRWRDAIFLPAGLGVYKYINGANSAVITVVGPDRDHGLPSDKRGVIRQLIGTHNDLLAILDGTTAPGVQANFDSGGLGSHVTAVISPDVGFSSILGWNEVGWETKWLGGSGAKAIDYGYVSNAYSTYRLWWAHNQRVYYMQLPRDIVNPEEVTDLKYATAGEHITPWFTANQLEIDKLALTLKIECNKMTATETVVVDYAIDYSATYTSFGTISASGVTTYNFPNATTPNGTVFRAIRFRLTFARGSTNTKTPDIISLTFEYRKKLPAKWGHSVEVDLTHSHSDRTPLQLRAALLTAIESNTLMQFTFRDDDGNDRNFYVDIIQATGLEFTGHDERGRSTLLLVEP